MKKLLLIINLVVISVLFAAPIHAQTKTPTPKAVAQEEDSKPAPDNDPIKSKINEIKEKIASTVAQRQLVTKKGVIGIIQKLEDAQITIVKNGDIQIIDIDELTKYHTVGSDKKQKETKRADLEAGDSILAIGLYNKESRKLLARFITSKEMHININGVVREVDIKDGTIKVEDKKKGQTFSVDIEKTTKITNYTKEGGLAKSGLSRIEIGQRAHVNGVKNADEENRISGSRVLLLPGKAIGIISPPSGQKVATPAATATPKITPTPTKPAPTRRPTATPTQTP